MDDAFCPLPFLQLELKPTLDVAPCCYLPTFRAGNLGQDSLSAIWNGPKLQSLRREFLSGDTKTCARAMRQIQCHRQYAHLLPLVDRTPVQTKPPRRLDVRLNGQCNLACVMCEVWEEPNGRYDGTEFWEKGKSEIFPGLVEIDVLGGEPFIQRDTFRLIDEVSETNPECTWGFVTNASWKFAPAIVARLDKIALRYLQVSLDSLAPKTYSQIRVGGDLRRTLDTVEALLVYQRRRQESGRGFTFQISQCVQQQNWREMGSFLDFCRTRAVTPVFQFLTYPRAMSLEALSAAQKQEILAYLVSLDSPEYLRPILAPLYEAQLRRHFA